MYVNMTNIILSPTSGFILFKTKVFRRRQIVNSDVNSAGLKMLKNISFTNVL